MGVWLVLVKTHLEEYFCLTNPPTQSIYQRLRSKGENQMNVEKLQQVERWLLAGAPERAFNMNRLVEIPADQKENWCGTACCIAGYVYQQNVKFDATRHNHRFFGYGEVEDIAAKALGISESVGEKLFYIQDSKGWQYEGNWDEVTAAHAAQAVRNVIDHGEPLWETILDFFYDYYEGDY